jgi:hypothetical protein
VKTEPAGYFDRLFSHVQSAPDLLGGASSAPAR